MGDDKISGGGSIQMGLHGDNFLRHGACLVISSPLDMGGFWRSPAAPTPVKIWSSAVPPPPPESQDTKAYETPLDQYTRATLNVISWNSESKWPNHLEDQGQWPPFSMPSEIITRCEFGANLVIVVRVHYKLSHRQAQFHRILSQNGIKDLEIQGQ